MEPVLNLNSVVCMQHYVVTCLTMSVLLLHCSVEIGPGSVVEYSVLGQRVRVGAGCIVSGLNIPANSVIPDSSFLHTLPVTVDERTYYTTFAFGKLFD